MATLLAVGIVLAGCADDEERSVEAFCAQLEEVRDIDAALAGLEPAVLDDAITELEALSDVAPDEIRSEVEELASAVSGVVEVVATATGDPMDAAEDALRAQEARRAQIERAGAAVIAYSAATCEVELGGTTSSTIPAVPAAPPSSVAALD